MGRKLQQVPLVVVEGRALDVEAGDLTSHPAWSTRSLAMSFLASTGIFHR